MILYQCKQIFWLKRKDHITCNFKGSLSANIFTIWYSISKSRYIVLDTWIIIPLINLSIPQIVLWYHQYFISQLYNTCIALTLFLITKVLYQLKRLSRIKTAVKNESIWTYFMQYRVSSNDIISLWFQTS